MSDSPGKNTISSQLMALLKVPVLPQELYPTTSAQNGRPLSDESEMIRHDEFRVLMDATFSLKYSNAVPQTMEIETIELFRKKCFDDISQDHVYIEHLQLQVNELLEELQSACRRQSRIRGLSDYFQPICSPVRRLPPEILTSIFEFCICRNAGPYSHAPLVLCHVSSLWRSVALGSPQLWNSLFLDFSWTPTSKYGEISNFWFRNSRNQPRSLSYCHGYSLDDRLGLQQWSEDLKSSSTLIRTLKCINFHPQLLLPFLRLPSSDVPLLEAVHLVSSTKFNEAITVLEEAPRLRVVDLDMSLSRFETVLPWSQLTSLKIHKPIHAAHWTVVFQQCLQLQYGSFNVYFPSSGNFASAPPVTLKHLEALCLMIQDDANFFPSHFQNSTLPSLRHLSLTCDFCGADSNMPFCNMAPCLNLVSLCLQGIYMDRDGPASLFALFMTTPALECLALDITAQSALDYLSFSALLRQKRTLLPNLSCLYLVMPCDYLTPGPDGICFAITSRFHGSSSSLVSLKHVSLFFQRNDDESDDEGGDDKEEDEFGFTAAGRVENAKAVIMDHPHSDGVTLHISLVDRPPKLANFVENIYCKWPQDY